MSIPGDYNTFIKGLHDIRKISKQVLEDKLREATIESSGMEGKYSIMNILLHAKKVEQERGSGHNVMTDQAMIGHIVSPSRKRRNVDPLTRGSSHSSALGTKA